MAVSCISLSRMDTETFTELVDMIRMDIERDNTNMREAISPAARLEITLRYLGAGALYHAVSYEVCHRLCLGSFR